MSRIKPLLIALGAVFIASIAGTTAHAQDALGLGGGLWFDSATRVQRVAIGPLAATTREDVANVYIGAIQLSFLHALDARKLEGFRIGADFRYLGFMATSPREDDRTDGIGRAIDLGFRAEWSTTIAKNLGLSLGIRAAFGLVFPEDDFATTIDKLRGEGVPTDSMPRPTVHVAPMVGLRWALFDQLHLRFDFGFGFAMTSLFDIQSDVQGLAYARVETITGTRFDAMITAELPLP